MAQRCKLCRRELPDMSYDVACRCGWTMDERCATHHRSWCPADGSEKWVGAVEL